MAIRIGCCLNLPPPTQTNSFSNSLPPKTSQLPISLRNKKSGEEVARRLPCAAAGLIMIGLETAIIMATTSSPSISYAAESQYDVVRGGERAAAASMLVVVPAAGAQEATSHAQPPRTRAAPPPKWSDTIRRCPAWRVNSLESIVPENLPRPSFRRRTEAARYAATAGQAPALKFSATSGGCFSM